MKSMFFMFLFFFFFQSCQNDSSYYENLLTNIDKAREENRIADLKYIIYKEKIDKLEEPYKSVILMEKYINFKDSSLKSIKYESLKYLSKAINFSIEEEYSNSEIEFSKFLSSYHDLPENDLLFSHIIVMSFQYIKKTKIQGLAFQCIAERVKKDNCYVNHLAKYYIELLRIMTNSANGNYEYAFVSSQALVRKLMLENHKGRILSYSGFFCIKNKLDALDTSQLQYYYELTQNCYATNDIKLIAPILINLQYDKEIYKIDSLSINEECSLISYFLNQTQISEDINGIDLSSLDYLDAYSLSNQLIHSSKSYNSIIDLYEQLILLKPKTKISEQTNPFIILGQNYLKFLKTKCIEGNLDACNRSLKISENLKVYFESIPQAERKHLSDAMNSIGNEELSILDMKFKINGVLEIDKTIESFYNSKNRILLSKGNLDSKTANQIEFLKYEINELDKKLLKLPKMEYLTSKFHQLKVNKLKSLQDILDLQNQISKPQKINLKKIQEYTLKENVQIIDMIYDHDHLYLLKITPLKISLSKLSFSENEKNMLANFTKLVNAKKSEISYLKIIGNSIYNKYFGSNIDTNYKNIVLCSSGLFCNFPFSALMTNTKKYIIQQYSLTQIGNIKEIENWSNEIIDIKSISALSFTDKITYNDENIKLINELPHTIKEIDFIKKLNLKDKIIVSGYELTRQNIKRCFNSDILHIATHGLSSPYQKNMNYLLLRDGLKIDSCFGFELDKEIIVSKLVILNSCNSNTGLEFKGEGIYSLSMTFLKKGTKNLISTTSKIEDKIAAELIIDFYKNLLKGYSIGASLQMAQLNYIKEKPYYWSKFICFGNPKSIYNFNNK